MKRLVIIALSVVALITAMPILALVSATNISALAAAAVSIFDAPLNPADGYEFGECTYWVALRRIQINQPIPNTWGDAITWAKRAASDGYLVDHSPAPGAIMQDSFAPGGLGHVAFVESVDILTGSWTISEMNRIGWDEVDTRTMSANAALSYNFIHN